MAQPFTDALQTWLKKRLLVTDRFMRSSACGFHQGQESKDSTNRPAGYIDAKRLATTIDESSCIYGADHTFLEHRCHPDEP